MLITRAIFHGSFSLMASEAAHLGGSLSLPKGARWKLRDGVRFFINPPIVCPYCEAAVPTNRVWITRERRGAVAVYGAWRMDDGTRIPFVQIHPHVGKEGGICTNGDDPYDVLWRGINPGGEMSMAAAYYLRYQLGHMCPSVERETAESK